MATTIGDGIVLLEAGPAGRHTAHTILVVNMKRDTEHRSPYFNKGGVLNHL